MMIRTDLVTRQDMDGIVRLTLNRPEARNALSLEMMRQLMAQLESMAHDEKVRVVILSGNGAAFRAGHDLKELRADPTPVFYGKVFALAARIMLAITDVPRPGIAEGAQQRADGALLGAADLHFGLRDDDQRQADGGQHQQRQKHEQVGAAAFGAAGGGAAAARGGSHQTFLMSTMVCSTVLVRPASPASLATRSASMA